MNLSEAFRTAVQSLLINPTRAMLTMLGIIIGIGSVITLLSIGSAVESYIKGEFTSLGANLLTISSREPEGSTRTRAEPLSSLDVEAMRDPQVAPSLGLVTSEYAFIGFVTRGGERISTSIRGVEPAIGDILNWYPEAGTFITREHVSGIRRVAVIGQDIVEDLFADVVGPPLGETLQIDDQVFTVVGVMSQRDTLVTNDDASIFVPITTAQTRLATDARLSGGYKVTAIYAQARSDDVVDSAEEEIDNYYYAAHDLQTEAEEDYTIGRQFALLGVAASITGILTIFLSVVAGISLVVGGIGIMNIMLVTVTERTREIGLRKAIGATPRVILVQFLFESLVLSLTSGAIGVVVGWLIVTAASAVVPPTLNVQLSTGSVIISTITCTIIGIVFGILPANRAARMAPIQALRYE